MHRFGGPEVLTYEEVPPPEPVGAEILVRVHAAGVNALDWLLRRGGFEEFGEVALPWIPGWDLSGVVADVGPGHGDFRVGDSVFGMVCLPEPGKAYAELAAVPVADVVRKPRTLDHVHAAATPMAALTAWRALFGEGRLQRGHRVLVHAAAGGVGHLAVQLAVAHHVHVVGTASGANEDFVRSLGADFVDYREHAFEEAVEPVDVVIDAIGGAVTQRSIQVLRPGGRLVSLPGEVSDDVRKQAIASGVEVRYFSVRPDRAALLRIGDFIERGRLRPTVSSVRPLARAAAAHQEGEFGHVRGKLVLDVMSAASG